MEQLFRLHAPHIEVFPPTGSGLPPEFAHAAPGIVNTFVPPTASQAVELKQEDLDDMLLMHDNDDEQAPLAEHFGQMALDAEGHLRCAHGTFATTRLRTTNYSPMHADGSEAPQP